MPIPVILQVNCGYGRAAIRELSSPEELKSRKEIAFEGCRQNFLSLFSSVTTYGIPEEYQISGNRNFNNTCEKILDNFSKKWHPSSTRLEYLSCFSTENWKHLASCEKDKHTLAFCVACYNDHHELQRCFPGKPMYIPPDPIISLPDSQCTITEEKKLTRQVLGELNTLWEERFNHSFTAKLPRNAPEEKLANKMSKTGKKKKDRNQKRQIVKQISQHLKENTTMTLLAEAESTSSYRRKRLALCFEKPDQPSKKHKSHSPSDSKLTWDVDAAMSELESFPDDQIINWSAMARKYNIPQKNAGQILKTVAEKRGIDVSRLDKRDNSVQRIRRRKKKLVGGEISTPCLPTVQEITKEKQHLIESGELSIGEPCTPYTITKSIATSSGEIEIKSINIYGRKIPLYELRQYLLAKQEMYMRINLPQCSEGTAQPTQCTRSIGIWHDHSTILHTGYILFAIWTLYDPIVFISEEEYAATYKQKITNLQEIVEEPVIYMIAPSTSSPEYQLALVPDRVDCLMELSKPITSKCGVEISDTLRFFCGDAPARQFERGTQLGGVYKCGSCGCKDVMMADLAHALQKTWRSLDNLQHLILAGKFGNAPGKLKPLDGLLVADLREELKTRKIVTDGKKKPQLQSELTELLQGAQRVPTLLTQNPTASLNSLNLQNYEILDCEPLHDLKGHYYNLLPELVALLPSPLQQECKAILDSTLVKDKTSGALFRAAAIKVLLKLQKTPSVDPMLLTLLTTAVKLSEILYLKDSKRTPKRILQLYNCSWLHHELCIHFMSPPKLQNVTHFFGQYLHDLVVHAPPQYEVVSLRSINAESQERLFSQAKHISLRATSRKPENVLPAILLSLQARQKSNETQQSVQKQETIVSSVAKSLSPYQGTTITKSFIQARTHSWQAHMQRISPFLVCGENVWWAQTEDMSGYRFFDSDHDEENRSVGPSLLHFSRHTIPDVFKRHTESWKVILEDDRIMLPAPFIRIYDEDGNLTTTRNYLRQPVKLSSTESPFESGSTISQELLQSTSLAPDTLDQESTTLTSEQMNSATPAPTNTALNADTPHHSKLLNPVSLFPVNDVPSDQQEDNSMECAPSSSVTPLEEDQGGVSIDFNLHDSDGDSMTIPNLQTKTAKLLYRAVGESSDLTELDNLRRALKEKNKQKGKKPSQHTIQQYKTLTVKLNLQVCSARRELKTQLVKFERTHYNQHGSFPDRSTSSEYDILRKKYDFIKKLLYSWESYITL